MQISEMIEGPIELVTFDLYDTLVESVPTRWDRFHAAVAAAGFDVTPQAVLQADTAGETFYTIENGRLPIRDRGEEGIRSFRLDLTREVLTALGLPTDDETTARVQKLFHDETQNPAEWTYRAFDEILEVLSMLADHGIKRAVISNADADVTEFCLHLGFAEQMDIIITSALVGWEKPDPRTFHAALDALGVAPEAAIHVGDQALSDVVGARGIGMAAALIDRYDRHAGQSFDAVRVRSLQELADMVLQHNDALRLGGG